MKSLRAWFPHFVSGFSYRFLCLPCIFTPRRHQLDLPEMFSRHIREGTQSRAAPGTHGISRGWGGTGWNWGYHGDVMNISEKYHGNMDKHRWFHGLITPGLHPQPLRLLDSYQRFAPTALSPSPLPPAISSSRPEALNNRYCHHQTIIGSKTLLCIIYIAKYISINAA